MLSQRHSLSFVRLGKAAFDCPFGQILKFLDFRPWRCYCGRFAMRQNLQITARNCILKIQKNPSKSASSIDIKPRQEQNCCVLLGSQTLGAEFYSALSLSSLPTIQN